MWRTPALYSLSSASIYSGVAFKTWSRLSASSIWLPLNYAHTYYTIYYISSYNTPYMARSWQADKLKSWREDGPTIDEPASRRANEPTDELLSCYCDHIFYLPLSALYYLKFALRLPPWNPPAILRTFFPRQYLDNTTGCLPQTRSR